MKLIEWNLHFSGNGNLLEVYPFVSTYLKKTKADIIILSEVVDGQAMQKLISEIGTNYKSFFSNIICQIKCNTECKL